MILQLARLRVARADASTYDCSPSGSDGACEALALICMHIAWNGQWAEGRGLRRSSDMFSLKLIQTPNPSIQSIVRIRVRVTLRVNMSIADFDLEGRIGDGSFSSVFLAHHRETGRWAAGAADCGVYTWVGARSGLTPAPR
jgi:hypothetical protein